MQFPLETLAALATIAGTIISIIALFQSRAWLCLTSLLCVCLAIAGTLYARRERITIRGASTTIEGHSIDALNIANLNRRINRTFYIQDAQHTAHIKGDDLQITWKYLGYCQVPQATSMEFSIDSENSLRFADLHCIAYDVVRDPEMTRPIRPLLVGTESMSKKISIPFLEPLEANQSFGLVLTCTLPKCIKAGLNYFSSTLSFAQARVPRCTVRLTFEGRTPPWVRVYDCVNAGQPTLIKQLSPTDANNNEYFDTVENIKGQSARVYAFLRDPL